VVCRLRCELNLIAFAIMVSVKSDFFGRFCHNRTFPARYRAFHRTPPVLGAFLGDAVFVPTASFRPPAADHSSCNVLDCRHDRVLIENLGSEGLSVWDPTTGDLRRLPEAPDTFSLVCNGTVLCAATAGAPCECDHLACHGGAFLVARGGSTWGLEGLGGSTWGARGIRAPPLYLPLPP
jgi:hypothetical protein